MWNQKTRKMFRDRKLSNDLLTYEIKFFQNYSSLQRRLSEIILFQRVGICLKFIIPILFPTRSMSLNYNFEIISALS